MRRSCALLLVAAALFITGCEQEGAEISPAELAATIRFDGEATLSRIKNVVGELHRGTAGDCEQVTKEVSGFRERGTKAIGTFHHVRPTGSLATPESIARYNASTIYWDYLERMKNLERGCYHVRETGKPHLIFD